MRGEEVKNPVKVTFTLKNGMSTFAEMAVLDHGRELRFFRTGTKDEINSDTIKSWDITIGVCTKCGRSLVE